MASVVASSAVVTPVAALAASSSTKSSDVISVKAGLKAGVFGGKSEWQSKTATNGSRVSCMQVWEPYNNLRFETLSYLPALSQDALAKQIDYVIKSGWAPCIEFDTQGAVTREGSRMPGYYDGRYWTMWKLPMFGCTDSASVLREIEECKKLYGHKCYIRCLGFDNTRQVWEPYNNLRFETLSYLPPLSQDALAKQIDYVIKSGWAPCIEFDTQGTVTREGSTMPGYYDGRYWTMWKLPMFGCTDSASV
ncbi:hypothetical protein Mp_4g06040 [Marchantia polymorpha subsp. ruderalis]|uniref:Ribulose bisphosphate carboxylase small subunit domain-containing protein n=2 Tax=Marchantia polymorpha TaxID=3197 RepID=A0AAF6B6U5_MARPO|nr:hypothetical protein MARPO_0114s0050 [Marchantia polymorpha]BBN07729.1 hypothetical protein Mp_4g06040 [Marchantia polymorpha subsp. ruderalis]|eukprot:PTQ31243.1 hypothetical protein MARPO_0114s0050 [Marchantia polymorpha]